MRKVTEFFLRRGITKDSSPFDVIEGLVSVRLFVQLLFSVSFGASAFFTFKFLSQPILESYGFRQAQTALTSYYLIRNGFSLSYWTPVLGQGWSIPFEFPIYQQLVAIITKWLGTPLTDTGRAVSWLLTALSCIPIYHILRELNVDKNTRFYTLALFMSSPLYLFWSGTFMIESTALFFVLCFVLYGTKIVNRTAGVADYALAGLFLTLGLLQKVTTALPVVLMFLGIFFLWSIRLSDFQSNKKYLIKTCAVVLVSLAIAYAWVKFSDQIKMENPLGAKLTSTTPRMEDWNFGNLGQRLSPELWQEVVWNRLFKPNLSGLIGVLTLSGGLLLAREKKTRVLILTALAAGFLPLLLFTNLHIVHTYYQTANGVFLLIALGLAVMAVGDRLFAKRPVVHGLFLAFFVAANFYFFATDPMKLKAASITSENNHILKIADYVKAHTAPNDVIIWYGFDWSSEAAFYAERKSVTVADWMGVSTDVIEHMDKYLRTPPAAVVLCAGGAPGDNATAEKIRGAIAGKFGPVKLQIVDTCEIYFLPGNSK